MSISRETPDTDYNGIENQNERRTAAQFLICYHNSLNIKKDYPTITELAKLSGLSPEELKTITGRLVENRRAYFNESGGLVLKGYEKWKYTLTEKLKANNSSKAKVKYVKGKIPVLESAKTENENSGDILENHIIIDYLSDISVDNSVAVANLLKKLRDNPSITDEKLSELVGEKDAAKVRRHLSPLYELEIVSFKRKNSDGRITYDWKFNGPKNLRDRYISDTQRKIGELEEKIKEKSAKPKYACEKFGEEHPSFGFDSDLERIGLNCTVCGSSLIFRTGEELAIPIEKEIASFEKAIEEVKKIKLNGSAEEAKQIKV